VSEIKSHSDVVKDYINSGSDYQFMLTITRDGANSPTSIYNFDNAVSAAEAYSRYDNFGFSKKFLEVCLYEPGGKIHTKILHRPPAGECTYVKQNYVESSKLIKSFKDTIRKEEYGRMIEGFALIFSQDNIRFNSERFFEDLEYIKEKD
jgi:hypothetical protein